MNRAGANSIRAGLVTARRQAGTVILAIYQSRSEFSNSPENGDGSPHADPNDGSLARLSVIPSEFQENYRLSDTRRAAGHCQPARHLAAEPDD